MVKGNGKQMESERWMNSECMESVWYLNEKQNFVSERRMGSTNKAQSQAQCEQRVIAEHKMRNLLKNIGRFYWLLIFNV